MSDFLLEIFSEEIPARMQKDAARNFSAIAFETLTKSGLELKQEQITTLISPRRIALLINNLEEKQKIAATKKIGPKIDADKRAIEGFLKANNLQSENQLEKIEQNKILYYAFLKPESEIKTSEIIKQNLTLILQKMTNFWPKLMRYDTTFGQQARWIRPVRNILCLFDSEIIDFEFFNLKSNNLTFGHFLYNSKPIKIDSVKKYELTLLDNFVIVNQEKRKKEIISQINKIKHYHNLETIDNEDSIIFDEITGLTEYPTALLAKIDEKFKILPDDVLILTLKLNQKYLCLKTNDGKLSEKFIFISNAISANENSEKIIKDNQKVVRARLEDALFFIEEDLKTPLANRTQDLKNIIFHKSLGSLFERCERVEHLAEFLAIWIAHCDISLIERASNLCKVDLTTKAVSELPELQGKIGSFYAQKQNEKPEISAAIYEHYLPLGINSELPQTPLGISLAISDKIDAIVGLFLANEKPTSSKDPFALRRAALGVIRICLNYNIAIPIKILVTKSLKIYKTKLVDKLLLELDYNESGLSEKRNKLIEEITKFIFERLKNFLKENQQIRSDILNIIFDDYLKNLNHHKYGDLIYLANKTKSINYLLLSQENKAIIELYKRSVNVLTIEEKKDNTKFESKPNRLLFSFKEEKNLYNAIKKIKKDFSENIKKGNFEKAFSLLKTLENPLSDFFDKVMVNDENKKLRENRLLLLAKIRKLFLSIADFSKLEL